MANTLDLDIHGMTCAACVARVERALSAVEGVRAASVNLATERARITFAGGPTPTEGLIAAVDRAGYEATVTPARPVEKADAPMVTAEFWTVLAAAVLTAPLVVPMLAQALGVAVTIPGWLQLALATPVQFGAGWRFYAVTYKAARHGSAGMDSLVALGTSAAFGLSLANLLTLGEHATHALYFEASSVIITLVLLGRHLEARAKQRAGAAIRALAGLRPERARVRRDGRELEIAIDALALGDLLIARPGERIAADGVIREGAGAVDESMLTGESKTVAKATGDRVTGGTMNGDGLLVIAVTAIGAETTLARVVRLVEDAQAGKAPIQRLADRVSAVFIPIVFGLALLTFGAWWWVEGDPALAVMRAVAVLVIACPCALGLATPTAILVGTGVAAKAGILIRDGEALERLRSVTVVAFDKTGTLTVGHPTVTEILGDAASEGEVLSLAAALQAGSEHPLARAVARRAAPLALAPVEGFRALPGIGVTGGVGGRTLSLGSQKLLDAKGLAGNALAARGAALEAEGATVSWLFEETTPPRLLGLLAFTDAIRPTARAGLAALKARGVETLMLTGDNAAAAARVAAAIGVDRVMSRLSPEDKLLEIKRLRGDRKIVAMVGDGVNDAPALAAADIGIAMGSGTDVAMATSEVTLMRSDPALVAAAIDLAGATYAKIRQNLFWAFAYNLIGIPLAALGFLNPMIAGGAMALSSVSVVANALLLKRWRPKA